MIKNFKISFVVIICYLLNVSQGDSVELISYISQQGIHGTIEFISLNENTTRIITSLKSTSTNENEIWEWNVHEHPVDYTVDYKERCQGTNVGKVVLNLDNLVGNLIIPDKQSSQWTLDHPLSGSNGLWGTSLVLRETNSEKIICSTLTFKEPGSTHIARAKFNGVVYGDVYFFWWADKALNKTETKIYSSLFNGQSGNRKRKYTMHKWKMFTTEILSKKSTNEDNCNALQIIFNPTDEKMTTTLGDLDLRIGKIKVSNTEAYKGAKQVFFDPDLSLLPSDIDGGRNLYLAVYFDDNNENTIMSCARLRSIKSKIVRTNINSTGFDGSVTMLRQTIFEPTWISFDMALTVNIDVEKNYFSYKIHNLPPREDIKFDDSFCTNNSVGRVYDPTNVMQSEDYHTPAQYTFDSYAIGDLSSKIIIKSENGLKALFWDTFLPLDGIHSVVHRGIVITMHGPDRDISVCGTLNLYEPSIVQTVMTSAIVVFNYPIVGRILFRQPKDQYWEDTSILVEYLIHADGASVNDTYGHKFALHEKPPNKDFYDWQNRCTSTGKTLNNLQEKNTNAETPDLLKFTLLGDLSSTHGTLNIAGSRNTRSISRVLFTDSRIGFGGVFQIIGKSFVIFDENGPEARGNRLACSVINGYHRRKAVAKDWFTNGLGISPMGKIELVQQSEYEITNIELELKGLQQTYGYHIHKVPINQVLEFPCEDLSIIELYNPSNINTKKRNHTEMKFGNEISDPGDLSNRFGYLRDDFTKQRLKYNDTYTDLFGYNSIIGRSIIIQEHGQHSQRWACSTIERGYSLKEAREVRAIASFHHPLGYAYGYMRFSQLIGHDGSQSDTTIEINLRYPGKYNRNVTHDHFWQIYVNPVSVDAIVKQFETRCVAGGYVWNPFYTQLADPLNEELYKRECNADNPYRCYVGDIGARLGTISIGEKRQVFTDMNFPLDGTVSAQGRSIVIFGPNKSGQRYACANIESDHDIIKYINIEKSSKFVLSQFLDDVRDVMGIPEWFLEVDVRKTRTLYNDACLQTVIHFRGPYAHRLEQDFSRLLVGQLDSPSIHILGYVNQKRKTKVPYTICSVKDPNEKATRRRLNKPIRSNVERLYPQNVWSVLMFALFKKFI